MRLYCNYFSQENLSHNFLIIKALQYRLFYLAKEPVLHGKRAYFALQNRHYYNAKQFLSLFTDKIFTKQKPLKGKINWQKNITSLYASQVMIILLFVDVYLFY